MARIGTLVVLAWTLVVYTAAQGAGADPREIKPGDTVIVTDAAQLRAGQTVVAELPKGTELRATTIQGDWVGGAAKVGGRQVTGWVQRGQVTLYKGGTAAGGGADWPGWLGPHRDNKSADTGLLREWPAGGPKLLWKAEDIGRGFSSATVAAGKVYVTGDRDGKLMLFALDLEGKPLWNIEHGQGWNNESRASPVLDRGKVYLLNAHGLIGCYDAASGQKKWTHEAKEYGGSGGGWGYCESVLIYNDMAVFKAGGKNCIVALDKTTGETLWTSSGFDAGPEYGSSIIVTFEGKPTIVSGTNHGIVAVDAANGKLLWSNPWSTGNTANCPTPAYADGHVFWANGYGRGGICLKLKIEDEQVKADQAWTTHDMDCHHGGYVIHEGYIYGNHGGGWACLDLKTGKRMWNEQAVGKGSLCFADGMLYLFSENGGQAALATCSPEGLKLTGKVKVKGNGPSWAHPVVTGGRLYLRYDANLYCFDVKQPG